jgi:hypothetical protein
MIRGVHFLLYSRDPVADQEALESILEPTAVPAGPERVIMSLPPAEIATHEGDGDFAQAHADRLIMGSVFYLMCDDIGATVGHLEGRGLSCTGVEATEFGMKSTIVLPSGGEIGLYQPSHPTALGAV